MTSNLFVSDHAAERMWERFNTNPNKILRLIEGAVETYHVLDRKKSYDSTVDMTRKKIAVGRNRAYFVIHSHNVVTVLTEEQAMNNFKVGKWTKL